MLRPLAEKSPVITHTQHTIILVSLLPLGSSKPYGEDHTVILPHLKSLNKWVNLIGCNRKETPVHWLERLGATVGLPVRLK